MNAFEGDCFAMIRANIPSSGKQFERDFVDWWGNNHVPEYVSMHGFRRGALLRREQVTEGDPSAAPEYLAMYHVSDIEAFNDALAAGPPWGPWHEEIDRYVSGWERTYYAVIGEERVGRNWTDLLNGATHWTFVQVDLASKDPTVATRFNSWYDKEHLPSMVSHSGILGGIRLRVESNWNELGPQRQEFCAIYFCSQSDALARARSSRQASGYLPWDAVWQPEVRNALFSVYERLVVHESG